MYDSDLQHEFNPTLQVVGIGSGAAAELMPQLWGYKDFWKRIAEALDRLTKSSGANVISAIGGAPTIEIDDQTTHYYDFESFDGTPFPPMFT